MFLTLSQRPVSYFAGGEGESETERERQREREKEGKVAELFCIRNFIFLVWRKSRKFLASLTCLDVNAACGFRSNYRYKNINFGVTTVTTALISE
jgi:hypothetical protein